MRRYLEVGSLECTESITEQSTPSLYFIIKILYLFNHRDCYEWRMEMEAYAQQLDDMCLFVCSIIYAMKGTKLRCNPSSSDN